MQNLSAPFIFQAECRIKTEHVLFESVFFSKLRIYLNLFFFFKITDPCVGGSFSMCSHDPIFRTNKESSICRQKDHRDIMQSFSALFTFQEECQMKIEHVLFPSVFSELRIRVSEGHFQCVHTIRLSEPTKIGSLKTVDVNGP